MSLLGVLQGVVSNLPAVVLDLPAMCLSRISQFGDAAGRGRLDYLRQV